MRGGRVWATTVAMMRSALGFALPLVLIAAPAMAAPWTLTVNRQEAILSDGDDSGEDAATTLMCKPKSGKVDVSFFLEKRVGEAPKGGHLTAFGVTARGGKVPVAKAAGLVKACSK